MPNTKSAIKKDRQDRRRHDANRRVRSRMHTIERKVRELITAKNAKDAATALREAQRMIDKAVGSGIIHRNTAARKIARLTHRLRRVV